MKFKLYILFSFISFNIHAFQKDSIDIWINQSKTKNLTKTYKKNQLTKAYLYIRSNKLLKPLKLSTIAYQFYKLKDTSSFFEVNSAAMELATKTNQAYAIGDSHWNLATYYIEGEIYDQAYYHFNKALPFFLNNNFKKEASKILIGMANIRGKYKDYIGSENLVVKSMELSKETHNIPNIISCYNFIGLLQYDLKEYDEAFNYYQKALNHYKELNTKDQAKLNFSIFNNLGMCLTKLKKYDEAIAFFNKELKKDIHILDFARILDNRALCKLKMGDTLGIRKQLFKALKIRDSLKSTAGIIISKIGLSNYFKTIHQYDKALQYAREANKLAKKIKNGDNYLTSLKQLAALDHKNSQKHLGRYIEFNDSLMKVERRMRNKFARIQFETNEYIEETERLSEQRIWILISSIGGLLILSLLYFVRVQRVQNEKLSIEAEHQKANEEVYVLTLQQQAKLEEERIKERNRISEELHDGILGKLFGTRFGLGFLPLQGTDETLEKHQSLLNELQDIEKEIRDVSHKLSDNFNSTDINFTSIIKQLLEDKSIIGNFTHSIEFDPEIAWKDVNEVTKANIYRIIQEALQNIIKHAKAKHVSLKFGLSGNSLSISIQDDGVGFNVKKGKKGIGIKNINSRLEKLKGKITIKSELGVGTTLLINTPHITIDGK
ncbi:tetratricopeptide repeat-containing sensor histidine kinase [Tenacibaculum litopenaei]|uniref:tetratricopeptide repeat-containing sensor histidine kinase n=1 Tax=Tenacibaculum litopenaei TaxID=396016 RepID=UPI0038B5F9FF